MPRAPQTTATSSELLGVALAAAPDMAATWALIHAWRRSQGELLATLARSAAHWDDGTVHHMILSGPVASLPQAFANPSWPAWADEIAVGRAVAALSSEQAHDPLERAASTLRSLHGRTAFGIDSLAVGSLIEIASVRPSLRPKMTIRQVTAARCLLEMADLPAAEFSHVARSMQVGLITYDACVRRVGPSIRTLRAGLSHLQCTPQWARAWKDSITADEAFMAAGTWNDILGQVPAWANTADLRFPVQDRGPRHYR